MKKVEKKERKSNAKSRVEAGIKMINEGHDIGSRLALIQQLIPIGLMAVEDLLQEEVTALQRRKSLAHSAFKKAVFPESLLKPPRRN